MQLVLRRFASSIPKPTTAIPDVQTFLTTIGRKCDEHAGLYENSWENLFSWKSAQLKEKGMSIQHRRYILAQVERLRQGEAIKEIQKGKKSYGGERKRKETIAKLRAEERNK